MSYAVAALVFIVVAFAVLAIDLIVPFDDAARADEVERGSTTILPEDR